MQTSSVDIDFSGEESALTITEGSGSFIITSEGFYGSATATVSLSNDVVSAGGAFTIRINTTENNQSEEIDLGGGAQGRAPISEEGGPPGKPRSKRARCREGPSSVRRLP